MTNSRTASVVAVVCVLALTACTQSGPPNGEPTGTPTPPHTTAVASPGQPEPVSPSPEPEATTPASSTTEPEPTTSATTATARRQVLVYFLIDAPAGFRLVREPQQVSAETPARGAVEAMIAGPDDPDYATPWNPAARVLGISDTAGVITVDLSGEAGTADVGSEVAALMKQQLIYTVTEQLGVEKRVLLHIDGLPAAEVWGVVDWATPEPRGEWSETLLLVGIDTPGEGASVPSPVVVSGRAAVFEATLPWRVLTPEGEVVSEGFAMTSEGMTMAPYQFEVPLPAGEYVIEITEDDPSDGQGGPLDVDTRRITVTG